MAKAKLVEPLQQVNKHKVASRKWRNWPDICQRVFNDTFDTMLVNQWAYKHPKAADQTVNQWSTTCWNAAWTAADTCQQALKDIIAMKGYAKEVKN